MSKYENARNSYRIKARNCVRMSGMFDRQWNDIENNWWGEIDLNGRDALIKGEKAYIESIHHNDDYDKNLYNLLLFYMEVYKLLTLICKCERLNMPISEEECKTIFALIDSKEKELLPYGLNFRPE